LALSRNSLEHSFLPAEKKQSLLLQYARRIDVFARQIAARPAAALAPDATGYGFICDHYKLCEW